jgi:hypothetical protein
LINGKAVCKTTSTGVGGAGTGICVQCSVGNETACNGKSCNPATNICTTTNVGSLDPCHSCQADSECKGGNLASPTTRCVPIMFRGATHGNYCLQRVGSGCTQPYGATITAGSLSGAAAENYCGINANATTCEALLDLSNSKICTVATDCGCSRETTGTCVGLGQGGLCQIVGSLAGTHCTIPCDSGPQCLASSPGNICAFDSTATYKYCQ